MIVRRVRLVSGLVLLTYLATHFINHALGLISLEAMEAGRAYRFSSIDAPTGEDEDRGPNPATAQLGEDDTGLEEVEQRMLLSPLIAALPKREQMIIHLRFFRGMTQSEIAARLGISQMHVSRLLARSLAQLRDRAGAEAAPG